MTVIPGPTAHSSLGASSSKRWWSCPGSNNMSKGCANQSSVFADEGTAAHEVGALCLQGGHDAVEMIDRVFNKKFVCDDLMAEAVQIYIDAVRERFRPENGDLLFIEEPFSLADLNPPADMFGTSDAIVYQPKTQRLCVLDLKYGAGVVVDVKENSQGRYYGLGAALKLKHLNVAEVEITIVQPRASHPDGPVRSEVVSAFDLIDWTSELMEAAARTLDPAAPLQTGEWCRFCPGKVKCPELRKAALTVARTEFSADMELTKQPPPVESLSELELSKILTAGRLLTDWYRGAQGEAHARLSQGIAIPDFKLVAKQARRKWSVEGDELLTGLVMEADIPPEHLHVPKLKSPAQMEKGLDKTQKAAMAAFVVKKSSGSTIAPAADKRVELAAGAALDFDDGGLSDDD